MVGQRTRAKQLTRDRIAAVATTLFLQRGFDEVTVSEVAAAAGVSKVTVFAHFSRKEDLLFDRQEEAMALIRGAVRARPEGVSPMSALRRLAEDLVAQKHPLSGLKPGNEAFLRTIHASPALVARVREVGAEMEADLAATLRDDPTPPADPRLTAALVVAAYRTVAMVTAEHIVAGMPRRTLVADHRRRLGEAFDVLEALDAAAL